MEIIREFFEFARSHKKLWLMPLVIFLLLLGGLLFVTQSTVVAPYIYAVF